MKYRVKVTRVCRVEREAFTEVEAGNLAEAEDKADALDLCDLAWSDADDTTENVETKVWPA